MPIYEFYCPENHRIYQFYARTLGQGRRVPPCPDDPKFKMVRVLSSFSVGGAGPGEGSDEARASAARGALGQVEQEFSGMNENDPRAIARAMRRMAELTGDPMAPGLAEAVRKLESGADPESVGDLLTDAEAPLRGDAPAGRRRGAAPARDPKLYDYP
jgi:hypothetical protein